MSNHKKKRKTLNEERNERERVRVRAMRMSNRKKKRKTLNEERNERERVRVRDINIEYDRLTEELGGVVVKAGKERRRATTTKKPSDSRLRKEDILFEAANYIKALMAELEDVKAMMAKDVEVRII